MGRSTDKETRLSEQRKYRSWTAQQKIEIVLAGLRGDRAVKDVCREHEISDTLFYSWRDKLLEGGREALAGKEERSGERELRRKIRELERALGRKTYELELGSDNGAAFTARRFRSRLAELGITLRRGGYRDPESQAFIESWFGKLKEREVWLNEYETLDDARQGIGGYVDRYHHRPHSRLDYKTPHEVKQTWEDLQNIAA